MFSTIEARGNKLFIIDDWENMYREPIRYKTAWPTGIFAADHPELIGKRCSHISGLVKTEDGIVVRLENGEHTKPSEEYSNEESIPKPRGCYLYCRGCWHKD
jgi:hypothetical protein